MIDPIALAAAKPVYDGANRLASIDNGSLK